MPCRDLGGQCSRHREEQVQMSWGRLVPGRLRSIKWASIAGVKLSEGRLVFGGEDLAVSSLGVLGLDAVLTGQTLIEQIVGQEGGCRKASETAALDRAWTGTGAVRGLDVRFWTLVSE